ncbi:TonB-dependent receptor [Zhongshania marina]|uniref:TonB-dependent receptor n=1 Tax=Zhongshania marina TaxID=2304603 RepID=A0A2S4HBK6_9GAMM|nr:TonB-dependent receptor [Marortus luteolus]POP51382.1 TonB-dependent receptor [Marortus luteolus]
MRPFTHAALTRPLLCALALACATATFADTATQAQHYELAAGPLGRNLSLIATQNGIPLAFDPALTQGLQSPALDGNYTPQQVLNLLIEGSGLKLIQKEDGSYTLEKSQNLTSLPAVKISASSINSPQTSLDYSRDELNAVQPRDVKELFKKDAAVAVGGSIPVNQKVYVRGVEETAMAVSIDGGRQNNKVFHHNATNLIDPSLLKAVRASAGVAAADDGPGAIGGSLVYETVDVEDLLSPQRNFGGFVDGRYSSNGDQLTTGASIYGRNSGFEALFYLNHTNGDDYEDGEGDTVRFTEPGLLSKLSKVAYEDEQVGRFELSMENVNDESQRPYRANFVGLTVGRPVPESRVYDLTRESLNFNYSRDTAQGLWNPSVTIASGETELETREVPLDDPTALIVYTGITESQSMTVKNTFYTRFGEIVAGVDHYDDSAIFRYEGDPDLEEQAENLGVFIQMRQTIGEQLNLSYGIRHDQQDFTGTDGSSHDDSGTSGNIAADYQINDYLTAKAAYAQVWGGVALAENFILNGGWSYDNIKAVEAENYSFALRTLVGGAFAEATLYQTDIENGRTPSYGGGPDLAANFKIDGYDIVVGFLGQRGEITMKYANIESEMDGIVASSYDGNYFTVPLGEIITISGTLNLSQVPVTLGMDAEFALENDAVEDSGAKQDSYTVVNAYVNYAATDNLNLRLSIDNLTDESYTDRASYGQEFTTVKTLLEPGRSIILSARLGF